MEQQDQKCDEVQSSSDEDHGMHGKGTVKQGVCMGNEQSPTLVHYRVTMY